MVRLARTAVAVVALAACGGGGGTSSSPAETGRTSTTTTPRPTELDLSKPIPAGSLHDTPRPPLENKGDDYVAIFESLAANFRWLTENPDPALVPELFVPGTGDHDLFVSLLSELEGKNWRAADDGYAISSVKIVATEPELVTLRVVDSLRFEQIVDANGDRIGEGKVPSPTTESVVLLRRDDRGHWRIADWATSEQPQVDL